MKIQLLLLVATSILSDCQAFQQGIGGFDSDDNADDVIENKDVVTANMKEGTYLEILANFNRKTRGRYYIKEKHIP